MVGQLIYTAGGRGRGETGRLYGLPVLRTQTDPTGWWGERRLKSAGRALSRGGVLHTLVPDGFDRWPLLEGFGLRPVTPEPLVRAVGGALALEVLHRERMALGRATVALRGGRVDRDMVRAAMMLGPQVRHLLIAAPRGGGELSERLRREFGIPILPPQAHAQVGLCFAPEQTGEEEVRLELYGTCPDLAGLRLNAPHLERQDRFDLPLLTVLWQGGKLEKEDLKIT